jgi:hypothetical protein
MSKKMRYGIMAMGPLVLVLMAACGIAAAILQDLEAQDPPPLAYLSFGLMGLAGAIALLAMILYSAHASNNPALVTGTRIAWIVGFIFGHTLVVIAYYFIYIRQPDAVAQAPRDKDDWEQRLLD